MNDPSKHAPGPTLSVIIPLVDAEKDLPALCDELYPFLDSLNRSYEVVFVDQGSRDRTPTLLYQQHKLWPDLTQVLLGRGQVSEDAAALVGLRACRGKVAIILPLRSGRLSEVIPEVLDPLDLGHDFVTAVTSREGIAAWRRRLLDAETWLRMHLAGIRLSDPDGGLYGYDRALIEVLTRAGSGSPPVPELLPALACSLAQNPAEIPLPALQKRGERSLSGRIDQAYRHLSLLLGSSRLPLRLYAVLSIGLAVLAMAMALLVGLFGLFVTEAGVSGVLLGLLLAAHLALGLGLFALYLDRIPGGLQGDGGFQLRLHLAPSGAVAGNVREG